MAIYREGDMWSAFDRVDHFIITTNSFIKRNGALVMGAGIAKQARDRYPGLDLEIGTVIKRVCGHLGQYGFYVGGKFCIFQVKHHFKDQAHMTLISLSAQQLGQHAAQHPLHRYALNFPGIGNGKLSIDVVKPVIDILPDNVEVWTYKQPEISI